MNTSTPAAVYPDRTEWTATPDGHALALRILDPQHCRPHAAVLCLHGLFSDGRFFVGSKQKGPAEAFLKQGYRVIVGELRGHGRSTLPPSPSSADWCFDEYAQQDIPALIHAASERHDGQLFVLAHSLGGYALMAALGLDNALQAKISGVCLLASAVNDYTEMGLRKRVLFHSAVLLAKLFGAFPARLLRLGVADEPAALMKQFADWAPQQRFASLNGDLDYWQCLARVTVPVWAGVGVNDRFHGSEQRCRKFVSRLASMDTTFVVAGTRSGFSQDFGHTDILRSAAAEHEVLPRLVAWMEERAKSGVLQAAPTATTQDKT